MQDSITDGFKRPREDREEPLRSPMAVWNPGEWLLLRLSHAHASHLLAFLNADETQSEIAKSPTLKALRDEINSLVDLEHDDEA